MLTDNDQLLLTKKSMTSCCLLQTLLRGKYDVSPTCTMADVTSVNDINDATGVLLIGDDALAANVDRRHNLYYYDLGHEWHEFSGRGMVYALWAVRKNRDVSTVLEYIKQCFCIGIDKLPSAIADVKMFSSTMLTNYLTNVIHWDLNSTHVNDFNVFLHHAHNVGLLEHVPTLEVAKA